MLSFFPRGVLNEILNLIESVSEGFPSYSKKCIKKSLCFYYQYPQCSSARMKMTKTNNKEFRGGIKRELLVQKNRLREIITEIKRII